MYYAAQPLQWIAVAADGELRVPIRIKPEMAKLELRLVPAGYRVLVSGEDMGETPLGALDVKAGQFRVSFEKQGDATPRILSVGARPGETASVSWGKTKSMPVELPRATIKLDGLADSWKGVEPLLEPNPVQPFMGDEKCGIKAVYMCRDDKYLYWRVDFKEVDPLLKRPKGVGRGLNLQVDIWKDDPKEDSVMLTQFNSEMNAIRYILGGVTGGSWKELTDGSISGKHSKNIFVGRVDWAWARKHFHEVHNPILLLANQDANWNWIQATSIQLDLGWIDFGK
jgi:hypothetical protein